MTETQCSGKCGEGLTWRLEDGILFIEGSGEMVGAPWSAHAVINDEIHTVIIAPGCTRIESEAFSNFVNLTAVTIPDTVKIIGRCAFHTCRILEEITLPSGLVKIGNMAFEFCEKLKSIVIPEGITQIDGNTFAYCHRLAHVSIPDSVTEIGGNAFFGCHALKEITLPRDLKRIGKSAFGYCCGLTHITIPGGVSKISRYAFEYCEHLESVTIEPGVRHIGEGAFESADLRHITIPDTVRVIGDGAFRSCGLTSVTMEGYVRQISENAFWGCTGPIHLTILHSMETTCRKVFENVPFVRYKEFPCLEEPWEWLHNPLNGYDRRGLCGDDLYWYQKGEELYIVGNGKMYDDGEYGFPTDRWEWFHHLYITPGCTDIGDYAFNCREEYDSYWAEVTWREENGCWGYYDERCHALESVHIPGTVRRIGFAAFEGCCRLEEVTIPGNVEEIGTWAFKNCDYLHDITIKEGVKRIGTEAFASCGWDHWSHKLYSITIPDSVTEIGEDAFRGVPHIEYHGPAQSENNWGAKHRNKIIH